MHLLLDNMKISHKIIAVILTSIILSTSLALLSIFEGRNQKYLLENIYNNNVTPLDNIRNIQLIFRELEFRMTGVQADVIAAIGSAPHLKKAIRDADAAWEAAGAALEDKKLSEDALNAISDFEKGYKGFKENMADDLTKAYLADNPDMVMDIYDKWLDYKPLIFKSIDGLASGLTQEVKHHYIENSRHISMKNKIIIILAISGIALFTAFALLIIRSINTPVTTVVKAAEHVSRGDFTREIIVGSRDEMGNMAGKLNAMIKRLGSAFSGIIASVDIMNSDTSKLSSLSGKLLKGAEEQRRKGEQVAVASNQMSQTIVDMARNATEAAGAAAESHTSAKDGKEVVNSTVESITMLAEYMGDTTGKIENLGKSLNEVGEIVTAIKDITDQTNLLALNAAIEAARSGEHGRGFAVVADEVKKLAERTSMATDEIESKIQTIQTKSEESISTMVKGNNLADESVSNAAKAGEALQKIVENSDTVTDMIQKIAAATEEQSSASEEVSQTMEYISGIINSNFDLAEELESSAKSLARRAQEVRAQTMLFKTREDSGSSGTDIDSCARGAGIPET